MDWCGHRCPRYSGHPKFGSRDCDGHRLRECRHHVADTGRYGHLRRQHRYYRDGTIGGPGHARRQWHFNHHHLLCPRRCGSLHPDVRQTRVVEAHGRHIDRLRHPVRGSRHDVERHGRFRRTRFGETIPRRHQKPTINRVLGCLAHRCHPILFGTHLHCHHDGCCRAALAQPRHLPHHGFQHWFVRGGHYGRHDQWTKRQANGTNPSVFQRDGRCVILAYRSISASFHPRGLELRESV